MTKIFVVDDEASIRDLVKYNLERAGFHVECLEDGLQALNRISEEKPDLLVLDLMLPLMDGLEVCRTLRQKEGTQALPIIMLTAKGEEIDRVVGLEIGADDYLTKPFSPRELVARVKALLRRSKESQPVEGEGTQGEIIRGALRINSERYEASWEDQNLELTLKEFQLLQKLATHPGIVFTRDHLLENIWGYEFSGDTRTVDVHIRHLRQKLESLPGSPELIDTIRGIGYRFRG